MSAEDQIAFVQRVAASFGGIRLGQGMVGKTTGAFLALSTVLAVVAVKLENPTVVAYVAGGLFVLYFVGVAVFAHLNPAAALLEGANLVAWQQISTGMKGIQGPPPTAILVSDPIAPHGSLPPGEEPSDDESTEEEPQA